MFNRNAAVLNGVEANPTMNSFAQSYSLDINDQNQFSSVLPVLQRRNNVIELPPFGSSSFYDPSVFQGVANSAASISTLFPASGNNLAAMPEIPMNSSGVYVSNASGYEEILGSMSSQQWELNKYASEQPRGNVWSSSNGADYEMIYHSYSSAKPSNELSLTLATSTPSFANVMNVRDQRSVIDGIDQPCLKFGSEYFHVIQEILTQVASYSLENLHQNSMGLNAGSDTRFEVHNVPTLRKQDIETKKANLLALLQKLDDCYNQCADEIHTVVSAFHAATDTDPSIHARFALKTLTMFYKSLRERISTYFLSVSEQFSPQSPTETSVGEIHKHLALQHMRKKEHQMWRPQRGLPEKSVSVLRTWMFQNFLHPYPKDSKKHLLAVKSGLTRSQVSNWFINARVRLWKPMIEEMCADMKRRKDRQNENTEKNHTSLHHRY